jgi:ubiquinone/menaquinone biosynthesis C-methylase UbiE
MLSIEEIKLLIEKLEKVKKEDFQQLIDSNLKILKDLATTIEVNNHEMIGRLDKTISWFKMDVAKKMTDPFVNEQTRRSIQSKIFQFGKSNIYNSLEIGPGTGMFSMDFRAWRLNYFLDVLIADYESNIERNIRRKFPPQHQKYLKFYQTRKTECSEIPQASCNFVFSWDTFVFFTQKHIRQYLHDIKRVLVPGGYCFIHYADCHYDYDMEQAKRGYWNYNTKTAMLDIIQEEGYEMIEMNQFKTGANYAIFKKPGKQNPVVYKISELELD